MKVRNKKTISKIAILILTLYVVLAISLNIILNSGDEIWNFQNVYKIYNGFKIYQDANVIVMPLFFWIATGIFKIFGANLFVFRVIHSINILFIIVFIYKLMDYLKIPRNVNILTILYLMIQQNFAFIRTECNYNNLVILIVLIGIYNIFKRREKIFLQSIITILIFLTKQNIGIYYFIGYLIYQIIDDKEKKKRNIFCYICGTILGILIFGLGMLLKGNLKECIEYTFGGITQFASENLLYSSTDILMFIFLVILNIILSVFFIKDQNINCEIKNNIKILISISIPVSLMAYPIFNDTHIIEASLLIYISIIFMLYNMFKEFKDIIIKVCKIVNSILITIVLIYSTICAYNWMGTISKDYPYHWQDPFFGSVIDKKQYAEYQEVIEFMKKTDKNVIILSNRAALYMIPLQRSNGFFDLIFKGNIGKMKDEQINKEIDNMYNVLFLIYNNESKQYYQEMNTIKEHVNNTRKKIGDIQNFSIYE